MADEPNTTAPAPAANAKLEKTPAKAGAWKTPPVIFIGVILLAVVFYFGLRELVVSFTHETTDNAFIEGAAVSVAPRVAGQVTAVHVSDNQLVHTNDLLLELDPASFAIAVEQKRTAAVSQASNVKTVLAVDALMHKKVATAEANQRKAQADADASAATARRAQDDFQRMEELRKQKTISSQEYDAAQAANQTAQAALASARENVRVEDSLLDEAKAQLVAAEAEVGLATAQWEGAQTNVASAELDFSYTKVFAPCDGWVTRKAVEPGSYLQAGQVVMSIVPHELWVVANFKETQLQDLRTNQPVVITVDSIGGKSFAGHVQSFQAGSGAAFSLLPPENAVGNYVKVVQRVPVKILFDELLPADQVLGPGMSVVPSVRVSDFHVPDFVVAIAAAVLALSIGALWWRAAKRSPLTGEK